MTQMKQLIQQLNDASAAYYAGSSYMSDVEFDILYDKLKTLEAETGIIYANSPTQNVGSQIITNIPKIKIEPIPMLSLKKIHTQDEVNNFVNNKIVARSIKCDGLSMRLIYKDGQLFSANTRGNGVEGGLVTEHAKCFLNIPMSIPYKEEYIIDGEAIIKYSDFEDIAETENLQNPRNGAAGSLNTLDLNIVRRRHLSFIAWDVIKGGQSNSFIENLRQAENYGFEIVYTSLTDTNEEILNVAKVKQIPCDGVVWRYDDIAYGQTLGRTEKAFNHAIAWKPQDEEYETTLLDIDYDIGRTGVLTPVAIFEPIEMDGSTVSRASLHNLSVMEEVLRIPYQGQKIWVYKANQIIPQIIRSESDDSGADSIIPLPAVCPLCGEPVTIKNDTDSKFLFCSNDACPGKFINVLDHFAGKSGLDIKGLSKSTLEKLMDWGWVNTISDLFTLQEHRTEWMKKPGFGEKSVDKVLAAIQISRSCDLDKFICALGIPLIGRTAAKALANHFCSWSNFIEAVDNAEDFSTLPNFGYEMNKAIHTFDFTEAKSIAHNFITFNEAVSQSTEQKSNLTGLTFVVTGKVGLVAKNRDELKNLIESLGGKVTGSVSKNTNYLINNDVTSTSAKNKQAQSLNIPILSEEDFIEMFISAT